MRLERLTRLWLPLGVRGLSALVEMQANWLHFQKGPRWIFSAGRTAAEASRAARGIAHSGMVRVEDGGTRQGSGRTD